MRFKKATGAFALLLLLQTEARTTCAQLAAMRPESTTQSLVPTTRRPAARGGPGDPALVRARRHLDRARGIFREEGVPLELVWVAHVESAWRPQARSATGAVGLWQLTAETAERFGARPVERTAVEPSTRAAARYLRHLLARYGGDRELALAAYNCGEGRLDRAIARGRSRAFRELCAARLLPLETERYVPAVLAAARRHHSEPGGR